MHNVQVITQSVYYKILTIDNQTLICQGEVWGVFCECEYNLCYIGAAMASVAPFTDMV